MEILLANLDLILTAVVVVISAIVFARRGQIDLLRELVLSLTDGIDAGELYEKLPMATRLLVSSKTVDKIVDENTKA